MIQDAVGVIGLLLIVEGIVLLIAGHPRGRRYFRFVPPVFWMYFLPMALATAGILPQDHSVYKTVSGILLPSSLILLLLSVNMRAILRLGWMALAMMLAGSIGVMAGAPLTMFLFKPWLPPGIWSGFGALSGSWIGGSANMLVVKEGIGTPDSIFFPMVIVDTVVAYTWMGILIACAGFQAKFDGWNRARTDVLDDINDRMDKEETRPTRPVETRGIILLFAVAFLGTSWRVGSEGTCRR